MASFKLYPPTGPRPRSPCKRLISCRPISAHFQPRSPKQIFDALEVHVASSGKGLLASLKDSLCWMQIKEKQLSEKEMQLSEKEKQLSHLLRESRAKDLIAFLQLTTLNNTRGLFEKLEDDLASQAQVNKRLKGSSLWELILKNNKALCNCVHRCTKIPADDHARQGAHCSTIYNVLSQHALAGKELAQLQAANGVIIFQRGPMSPEQVQIFLCMGQAAGVDIAEDPSTRPS